MEEHGNLGWQPNGGDCEVIIYRLGFAEALSGVVGVRHPEAWVPHTARKVHAAAILVLHIATNPYCVHLFNNVSSLKVGNAC